MSKNGCIVQDGTLPTASLENKYEFNEIVRDCEGDLVGDILFNYNNDTYRHEFTFNAKENELISIDYGWKIPFIKEVWEEIENHLKNKNRQ